MDRWFPKLGRVGATTDRAVCRRAGSTNRGPGRFANHSIRQGFVPGGVLAATVAFTLLGATSLAHQASASPPDRTPEVSLTGDGGAALALGVLWLVPAAFLSPASMKGSYTQPNDPSGLWAIDKVAVGPRNMTVSRTSDVVVGGLLAGGAAYAGLALADPDRRGRGAAVVESVLLTGAVVEWLKVGVGRDRPYTYDSLDGIGEDFAHRSFPSGHTAMAVATATSLTIGWARSGFLDSAGGKWATAGVWTAAVTTASLRVVSSSHFPTDVITSSAIAVGCALLVEGAREWTMAK